MKHFTVWQWTDFVRGQVEDDVEGDVEVEGARSAMEAHLSSRCPRCERIVNVLRAVTVTARAESGYEPPERAIRYARAIYSLCQPEKISVPRLIARLVFDSDRAPLPAGMRAQSRLSRHTLYEAGSYYLDVQLEQQPGSGLISLTGQLADRNKPAASTADLPVRLMERKSLVAGTLSNRFGEFQLECAPARNLLLQVPLPAVRKRLEVSLGDFYAGPADRRGKRPVRIIARATKRRAGGK